MTENKNQYRFDSVDLILYLWKKKIPLMVITGIAAVASIIVSLTIDEKFESEVILFPAASSSVSHDLLAMNIAKKEIMKLGEDEEVEQLLQVLNSDEIRVRIIEKYNLMKHYDIDPAGKFPYTELYREFNSNIEFTPTKFMSVRIGVMDKDAQTAADIANDIAALVDTIKTNMLKERALEALALVEHEYISFQNHIKSIEDSLTRIRLMGIVDYESQAEVTNQAYAEAILRGNTSAASKLQKKLDIMAKYGGAYVSMRDYLLFANEQMSRLKAKYAEATLDATQSLPTKFVVKAEKKSYPVRWLIVLVSTISAFIFAILLLVIVDAIRKRMDEIKSQL
jgi:LPS O-antigen subunit length determinant protein (WzzB/FepE family)